ncbi:MULTISPECIES: helix-turn-helix domain-containing protein [Nesterenkonia]|nr:MULTISPECIES: helix-turn-helix domain-containing protein [Nesterenkonia]
MSRLLSVADAADVLGVSPPRVRAQLQRGHMRGQKVGGHWLIEADSLPRYPRRIRPMSQRLAWAILDPERMKFISARERLRVKERLGKLAGDAEPELLLRDWVSSRAARLVLHSRSDDLAHDQRLHHSGILDPRSGMSGGSAVEGYVRSGELEGLIAEHLLVVPRSRSGQNVFLHVVDELPGEVSPLLIAADLADYDSARELGQARRLIQESV